MTQIQVKDKALAHLSEAEKEAYDLSLQNNEAMIDNPTSTIQMYEAFVHGITCEELSRTNNVSLGLILRIRVEYLWDDRKDSYVNDLYENANKIMKQTAVESVTFLHTLLAATHKLHGEQIRRFLQTGDPKDLGKLSKGFKVDSIKQYKEAIETLMKITGSDQKKEVRYSGEVSMLPAPVDPAHTGKYSDAAAKLLEEMLDEDT